jgi:nitrite reductase/ring-hydroxylating ferredoxin subunit
MAASDVADSADNGWHRVDPVDVPQDGRVRSVVVGGRTVAMARCGARLGALENRCPHQGGPLGEGSIEKGLLRCPWGRGVSAAAPGLAHVSAESGLGGICQAVRRHRHPRRAPRAARRRHARAVRR